MIDRSPAILRGILCACVLTLPAASTFGQAFGTWESFALTKPGDIEAGQKVFRDQKQMKCLACHKVGDEGGTAGPDLSSIGGKFDRPHLIESMLNPSKQIVEGYRTTTFTLSSGLTRNGIIKSESETDVVIMNADGKRESIPLAEIEERSTSPVSLMPEKLHERLSGKQFTDLIAYLESLRSGKSKPGGRTSGPINLPADFTVKTVATGFTGATALETCRDGRVFVCEQPGQLRVIRDGELLDAPFVSIDVENYWERGLIGVTLHPDFPKTPYVYVVYVAKNPYPHHRISRFTAAGDVAVSDSEQILLKGDDQRELGGNVPAGHQGGAIHFGPDGMLYVAIGEQTAKQPSQKLDTFQGKILRIAPDGSIPSDNPFYDQAEGKFRAIWALGLRNPFTMAFERTAGSLFVNDVGGSFEEVNIVHAGQNFGWPTADHGPVKESQFTGPIHHYKQASISGGDFVPSDSGWPLHLHGQYLFADYVHGWIHQLTPQAPFPAFDFGSGLRRPVDLRFSKTPLTGEGSAAANTEYKKTLYVLVRNAWVVDGKFQPATGSLLAIDFEGENFDGVSIPAGIPRTDSVSQSIQFTEDATDDSAGDLPAYRIKSELATFYLEKQGGGLSSMVDPDGNDWLSFHPKKGSGAGGEFRGFPNAVYKQPDNYFHPMNAGTSPCKTQVEVRSPDRVSIRVTSADEKWEGVYSFYANRCEFELVAMPPKKHYWVLYEGTPGGQYDDDDWWMTSRENKRFPLTTNHEGDIPNPEWIAFGDKRLHRSLFLLHHTDDRLPDRFYQMQKKMTVFGFGRQRINRLLDTAPQKFTIGFLETVNHGLISQRMLDLK